MADYERMNLENGDTVYAEHVDHIEDALVQNEQNITTNEKNLDYLESDIEELQNCCTTVNETLDDLKEQTAQNTEDIELLKQGDPSLAFAVYSEDDYSVTFYAGYTEDEIPEEGSTYKNKTVTEVYTGFDTEKYTSSVHPPWYSQRSTMKSINFDESFFSIKPVSTAYWFYNSFHTEINNLNYLNTSNVTDMSYMFSDSPYVESLDCSNFDTSNVTSMNHMFYNNSALTSLDVSNFDTHNVTSMNYMFSGCSKLDPLDISSFNTRNVTSMSYMFSNCSYLESLDVSNLDTRNVTTMSYMFYKCTYITSLNVNNFNTAKVSNMSYMFSNCSYLTTIYSNDNNFVTNAVISGNNMFDGCSSLIGGNGTTYNSSNSTYAMAHVDTAENPGYFTQAKDLDYAISEIDKLGEQVAQNTADIEDLKTGSGSGSGSGGSGDTTELEKQVTQNTEDIADLQTQVTQNTEDIETLKNGSTGATVAFAVYSEDDYSLTFYAGTKVPEIDDSYEGKTVTEVYTGFDTEDYTNLSAVPWYSQRTNINTINFDKSFSIIKPVSTAYWFYYDIYCTKINNIDYLNTSNVTNMQYMFYECYGLTSLDLSSFDTRNVTKMNDMFYYDDLTSLNLNNFNTSNVTNMDAMFRGCTHLTSLDLSSFDTSKVTNMQYMFYNDSKLVTIYSSNNFVTTAVTSGNYMFTDCNNLVGGNGTLYDSSKVDYTMAHIDTPENAGYFTQVQDLDYALDAIKKLQEEVAELQATVFN